MSNKLSISSAYVNAYEQFDQLTLPGIEYAPRKVQQYGLRESNRYLLVSPGKDDSGEWTTSFRVPATQAWDYPELEYGRTATSTPALLFDMDGDPTEWLPDVLGDNLPTPNWIVWRRENMHAHVCYTLERPVLTGEHAKRTPQAYLARIGEYMALTMQADRAHNGHMGHNPLAQASKGRYRTDWMRKEPYSLAELGACIPKGWRRPLAQPMTVHGRNDLLLKTGMSWSGRPSNWGNWEGVAATLAMMNAAFPEPLPERELNGIIKSVIRYQKRNLESGQTQRVFSSMRSSRGKRGGKKSGEVRRAKTEERDMAIIQAVEIGQSLRAVGRQYGLNPSTVLRMLRREGVA